MTIKISLSTFSADTTGQLDVFGHDGHPLGVDGAQVGVLKQTDQISLGRLLESHDGGALEAQVGLEVLSDLPHQALEGQLADQQLGGFLVATDLPQSHCTGTVTVRLLHSTGGRRALASCLGGELLPGGFATGGLTGGLLGSGHDASSLLGELGKFLLRGGLVYIAVHSHAQIRPGSSSCPHWLTVGHVICHHQARAQNSNLGLLFSIMSVPKRHS